MLKSLDFIPIEGYADYAINQYGDVKNIDTGHIIKPSIDHKGYKRVALYRNREQKRYRVHRLVALHFIPNPENKPQVNHIDCNKQNNHYENLEWSTCKENMVHASQNNLTVCKKGEECNLSLLSNEDALSIKYIIKSNLTIAQREIAKIFNVSIPTVSAIKTNRNWAHLKV